MCVDRAFDMLQIYERKKPLIIFNEFAFLLTNSAVISSTAAADIGIKLLLDRGSRLSCTSFVVVNGRSPRESGLINVSVAVEFDCQCVKRMKVKMLLKICSLLLLIANERHHHASAQITARLAPIIESLVRQRANMVIESKKTRQRVAQFQLKVKFR